MEKSGLLKVADATVKTYRTMLEQLSSDPQTAQQTLLSLNQTINLLAQEVAAAEEKLNELEALKEQFASLQSGPELDKTLSSMELPTDLPNLIKSITEKK